ncbi:MAG: 2-phospho-L-lactate transferase [Hyphomicrobiales bacterium]|nr:2-phospho-L-lactate transferase [Hyphomicrobiales bacterium]MBV8826310.1 2-phospho-L-lactate transferase [Hyphomicrobiales bacterium]
MSGHDGAVLALSGGIGGAKLALGLSRVLPPERLIVVANTGDDFEHLGLAISPDLDTLMYTLAGLSDPERGWGRREETWTFMAALAALGGETWFQLGDGDLASHVERTHRRAAGETLSHITDDFCRRLGIGAHILPMSDDRVATRVRTPVGWLDFQDYFVRRRCAPEVSELAYDGAAQARPHPGFMAALADAGLRAVIICPSNPYLSVDPILALPGVRAALAACAAPVIAVSPIIGGRAVKGPTAKMMRELGLPVTAAAVAQHYDGLVDLFVVDHSEGEITLPNMRVSKAAILMTTLADREALAKAVLTFADELRAESRT